MKAGNGGRTQVRRLGAAAAMAAVFLFAGCEIHPRHFEGDAPPTMAPVGPAAPVMPGPLAAVNVAYDGDAKAYPAAAYAVLDGDPVPGYLDRLRRGKASFHASLHQLGGQTPMAEWRNRYLRAAWDVGFYGVPGDRMEGLSAVGQNATVILPAPMETLRWVVTKAIDPVGGKGPIVWAVPVTLRPGQTAEVRLTSTNATQIMPLLDRHPDLAFYYVTDNASPLALGRGDALDEERQFIMTFGGAPRMQMHATSALLAASTNPAGFLDELITNVYPTSWARPGCTLRIMADLNLLVVNYPKVQDAVAEYIQNKMGGAPVAPPTPTPPPVNPPEATPPPTEPPTTEPPPETPPGENPPTEEPPSEMPPEEQPPAEEPPKDEPPADAPPAEEPPKENPPADGGGGSGGG